MNASDTLILFVRRTVRQTLRENSRLSSRSSTRLTSELLRDMLHEELCAMISSPELLELATIGIPGKKQEKNPTKPSNEPGTAGKNVPDDGGKDLKGTEKMSKDKQQKLDKFIADKPKSLTQLVDKLNNAKSAGMGNVTDISAQEVERMWSLMAASLKAAGGKGKEKEGNLSTSITDKALKVLGSEPPKK